MRDLINRQAAIDKLRNNLAYMQAFGADRAVTLIEELPSAQPEKRTDKRTETHECDLIDRQEAIDAIDKALSRTFTKPCGEMILKDVPSAQPEIIRCRDCKHYYYADNRIPQEQRFVCELEGERWRPDDYCSYAERRTDD